MSISVGKVGKPFQTFKSESYQGLYTSLPEMTFATIHVSELIKFITYGKQRWDNLRRFATSAPVGMPKIQV